jgi:aspartate aminotransferase/aminotransferase
MTLPLSPRVADMPRSAIRQVMALANEYPDIIHFEVGEPLETTPPGIVDAAFAAVRAGATKYVPNAGSRELRELVARRIESRTGRPLDANRVIITTGAVGALFTAITTSLGAGSDMLVPDPGWPNYYSIASFSGVRCIPYRLYPERGFQPNLAELEALITPATRAILMNSPGNPTGAVFSRDCVQAIVEMARKHQLYIISDEIYEDIVFDGRQTSVADFDIDDQSWIVSGFSKCFAMTGWRIGWLVAPAHAVTAAIGLQEPTVSCVSAPSQAAATAALRDFGDEVGKIREAYRKRRDIVVEELAGTGLLTAVPQGGFYALLDISGLGMTSMEAAMSLIRDHKVALVPGGSFGPSSDRFLRMAFTTADDQLREGWRSNGPA